MVVGLIVVTILLFFAWKIGSLNDEAENFENFFTFGGVFTATIFISIISNYISGFGIFFGTSIEDIFLSILNNNEDYISASQNTPGLEKVAIETFRNFFRLFLFSFVFFVSYIVIFIKRFKEAIKIEEKRRFPNRASGVAFVIEMALVISISIMPLNLVVGYYDNVNKGLVRNKNNICQEISFLDDSKNICFIMDRFSNDLFLRANSYNFTNIILANVLTDGVSADIEMLTNEMETMVNIFFESNMYKIILDPNFTFQKINEYDIKMEMMPEMIEILKQLKFIEPINVGMMNKMVDYFYVEVSKEYINVNVENLYYDKVSLRKDMDAITDLMNFVIEHNLMDLIHLMGGNIGFSEVMDVISHMKDNNMVSLSVINSAVRPISNIHLINAIEPYVKDSFGVADKILSWYNSSLVTSMYVSVQLMDAMDNYMKDFRQTPEYEMIREIILELRDARN